MHDLLPIIVFSSMILGYGLLSEKLEKLNISGPMVAVSVGMLAGGLGYGIIHSSGGEGSFVQTLGELTLVIILFTDAARIDVSRLSTHRGTPLRLLVLGMPLSLLFGAWLALWMFPALDYWPAFVLAALLMPTDAALGEATVTNPNVPEYMRQSLNTESGLNDGLALPAVLVLVELANLGATGYRGQHLDMEYWQSFLTGQLVIGGGTGLAVGLIGGALLERAAVTHSMSPTFQRLAAPAMALLAFAVAEYYHGNGFIAAFTAGLFLATGHPEIKQRIDDFGKAEGEQLALLTFLVFGAIMAPRALPHLDWQTVVYALLSLGAVRMSAVFIALLWSNLDWRDKIFAGWFGPRGLASILFTLIVLDEARFISTSRVEAVVFVTVVFSIFLHGITARPAAHWFGHRKGTLPGKADFPD